jgi:hypothetical protein
MWPMTVVPRQEERKLAPKRIATVRDDQPLRALVFESPDESFNNSKTAVLADGSKPLADPPATAPSSEAFVGELRSLIGDQMSRHGASLPNGSSEEGPNRHGRRRLLEHGESHHPTREVIHNNGDPPAERPALRCSPRQPGGPKA